MKNILLTLMVFGIVGCNVAPTVDSSWMNANCSSVYYNPSSCQNYSDCSCDAATKNYSCTYYNGKYFGQIKDGSFHGKGSACNLNYRSYP